MLSLPDELLAEIFADCTSYCADAPVLLSLVCRDFSRILKRSPPAWRRLSLSLRSGNERAGVRKTLQWLKMSGVCSVSVCLDTMDQPVPDPSVFVKDSHPMLIAVLQRYKGRIASLDIRSKEGHVVHTLLEAIYRPDRDDAGSNVLRCLRIQSASGFPSSSSITASVPVLPPLPQLHTLHLTNYFISLPPQLPDVHVYAGLRKLTILRPLRAPPVPPSQLLRILGSAPYLTDVEIETRITGPTTNVARAFALEQPTAVPNLRTLSLRTNNISLLLGPLRTPVLHSLRINDLNGRGERSAQKLSGALLQVLGSIDMTCGGGLKILELFGANVRFDATTDWEDCFRLTTDLERLVMINMDAEGLFTRLAEEPLYGQVLPALRHVTIHGVTEAGSLERFQQRWPGVHTDVLVQREDGGFGDVKVNGTSYAGVWLGPRMMMAGPKVEKRDARLALVDYFGTI